MITLLVTGRYDEAGVRLRAASPSGTRSSAAARAIASGWARAVDEMVRTRRRFHDGPLVRFEGVSTVRRRLVVRASPSITYRDVVGYRSAGPDRGAVPVDERPNPLSVLTVVRTVDGHVALGWRTSGDWRPSYEVSGGFVRRGEGLFEAARNRLGEDFGDCGRRLERHELIALYSCDAIGETVALFVADTRCDACDVERASAYPHTRAVPACATRWPERLHRPSAGALELYRALCCDSVSGRRR